MAAEAIELDRGAIEEVDRDQMLERILEMPEHLSDALWRVESAAIAPVDTPGGLVVAAMGGSAIGGALACAALGDRASRPILAARGYGLPSWTTPDTTVLCASYSGDTEETLACFEAAGALGSRRIVVTTGGRLAELARIEGVPVIPVSGGLQPRAAMAYMLVSALEVAALCGAAPRLAAEIDVAAAHLGELAAAWGPDAPADSQAKSVARDLYGTVPVIMGAASTSVIAYRWKTQINENAKLPAFAGELPELDHNEIAGWTGTGDLGPFSAVFLDDCDTHPRIRSRIALTEAEMAGRIAGTRIVESQGETALSRLLSLVLLGDLVSLYLAVLGGVDPTPVTSLTALKRALAEQG